MNETYKTKRKYDRIARFYDTFEGIMEKRMFHKWRKETLGNLTGKILEIGVGTGKNLQYYHDDVEVTGIDISDKMLAKAIQRAKGLKKELKRDYELVAMDAQNLVFSDNSFDYVVTTFVLCSIPNPVKALQEMKRVVKQNGRIILIEHVLSKNKVIALVQNLANHLSKSLIGVNINRNTKSNIEKAGLKIISDENLAIKDVFRRFICVKNT